MTFKKFIFQLHKILGLTTGLVVFIVAITGCCWAFKEEIESLYDDYKKVVPQNQAILTPTQAKQLAKDVFPNNTVHGTLFKKADDAIEVIFYDAEPEFYQSVFLNPYSGKVIQVDDHLSGFFCIYIERPHANVVTQGHRRTGGWSFYINLHNDYYIWIHTLDSEEKKEFKTTFKIRLEKNHTLET